MLIFFISGEGMNSQMYPSELQLNSANASDTECPFSDLHGFVFSIIFDFDFVKFPYLDGDISRRTSYGALIAALIRKVIEKQ